MILYCHCAFAKVVPVEAKRAVLARIAAAPVAFEAVPDLCEMSARKDPRLGELAAQDGLRIAACFPRAVRGLFEAAGQPLAATAQVFNMRAGEPDQLSAEILDEGAPA
ncbi:MAG: hypothetical protein IT162_07735 [Bryobacterales bacterium]|nr:hypothetical protein [Bryobacterales bacterium]